ncbi:PREDICTED: caspase-1-like isoform X2 [Wasmannia auropunctata]|uniref:caspase-1-like isoform X2 n=1 Tax=Wasmannia auropunctata TaxID=64793 RepID=UPI0005F02DC3|nr:PREDICTED: caspase-1-like isoform X2 [Wasmannia auropunctata]
MISGAQSVEIGPFRSRFSNANRTWRIPLRQENLSTTRGPARCSDLAGVQISLTTQYGTLGDRRDRGATGKPSLPEKLRFERSRICEIDKIMFFFYVNNNHPTSSKTSADEPRARSNSTSPEKYQLTVNIAGTSQSDEKKSDKIDATGSITPEEINTWTKKEELLIPSKPIAFMPVPKDADCYNMNHKNRGKCIIFNHEKFNLSEMNREGSLLDVMRLRKSFGNLDFDVETYDNLTHAEIMKKINEVSQLYDHTDNDCLCVIALTHGIQHDMIFAKDVVYSSDTLWKPFTADKCSSLAGKPKLFFIQACRGDQTDGGIQLQCSSRSLRPRQTETDSAVSYAIPSHADFLIAHSSMKGFFTWRNPSEGTWYIQCLCDILDEHGTTMDLMNMLTLTSRKVATEFSSVSKDKYLDNQKQVPSVTTMLIRSVYFPPKKRTKGKK